MQKTCYIVICLSNKSFFVINIYFFNSSMFCFYVSLVRFSEQLLFHLFTLILDWIQALKYIFV